MYRLCYAYQRVPDDKPQYILVDYISNMSVFQNAISILRSLHKDADRIKYVETAYQEFLNLKESMREYTRIGQIKLEMSARAFFTEFDVFLKHWEKRISCHSRKEKFRELYDHVTHEAYDNSDDYAMATIIRNYAIHSAEIINGTVWGSTYYDVSIWKCELMKDDRIKHNKKKVINRQSSGFILLHPLMKGALEKLIEIQKALLAYTIDEETRNAISTVVEIIKKIKEHGAKQWFFTEDDGSLWTQDEEGRFFEYIQGKVLELFDWKDFDELITTVSCLQD